MTIRPLIHWVGESKSKIIHQNEKQIRNSGNWDVDCSGAMCRRDNGSAGVRNKQKVHDHGFESKVKRDLNTLCPCTKNFSQQQNS
jgi:hypothetical protein